MARALPILLASLALSGCLGSEEKDESRTEPVFVQAHRVQIQLEPGWQMAERSLTPNLSNPKELLSVGTIRMRPGGQCGQLPSSAAGQLDAQDALITIQERSGGSLENYPRRPERFRFAPTKTGTYGCAPKGLRAQWLAFSDAGRRFYAWVVAGRNASVNEVEAILNSFDAQPDSN